MVGSAHGRVDEIYRNWHAADAKIGFDPRRTSQEIHRGSGEWRSRIDSHFR